MSDIINWHYKTSVDTAQQAAGMIVQMFLNDYPDAGDPCARSFIAGWAGALGAVLSSDEQDAHTILAMAAIKAGLL